MSFTTSLPLTPIISPLSKYSHAFSATAFQTDILIKSVFAQETTLYGKDLYGEKSLHKLLKELCKIPGLYWIRIQYCYPEEIYDELIQTIAEEPINSS